MLAIHIVKCDKNIPHTVSVATLLLYKNLKATHYKMLEMYGGMMILVSINLKTHSEIKYLELMCPRKKSVWVALMKRTNCQVKRFS